MIDSFRRAKARRLRANATASEARLWKHLRHHPMMGSHFRRQVPIGPYVADFACMAAHLVIEIDGSQHGEKESMARDSARTAWLQSEGYKVIRFWNNDIVKNMEGVLIAIHAALYGADGEQHQLKHRRHRKIRSPHPGALRAPTLPLQGRVKNGPDPTPQGGGK